MSDYLELDRPVPFKEGQHYFESALMRPDGQTSKGASGGQFDPSRTKSSIRDAVPAAMHVNHGSCNFSDGFDEFLAGDPIPVRPLAT